MGFRTSQVLIPRAFLIPYTVPCATVLEYRLLIRPPHVPRPTVLPGQKGKFAPTTMREARLGTETEALCEPTAR
jgi:hypothetical protein